MSDAPTSKKKNGPFFAALAFLLLLLPVGYFVLLDKPAHSLHGRQHDLSFTSV